MELNPLELERIVITSSLLYGAFTTWFCPCGDSKTGKNLLSCHLSEAVLSIGMPLALILYVNKNLLYV